jgi:hypothetical protein
MESGRHPTLMRESEHLLAIVVLFDEIAPSSVLVLHYRKDACSVTARGN